MEYVPEPSPPPVVMVLRRSIETGGRIAPGCDERLASAARTSSASAERTDAVASPPRVPGWPLLPRPPWPPLPLPLRPPAPWLPSVPGTPSRPSRPPRSTVCPPGPACCLARPRSASRLTPPAAKQSDCDWTVRPTAGEPPASCRLRTGRFRLPLLPVCAGRDGRDGGCRGLARGFCIVCMLELPILHASERTGEGDAAPTDEYLPCQVSGVGSTLAAGANTQPSSH
jgi:hypothetical protein